MRFLLLIIFIIFPFFSYGSLNGSYLFCELTPEYSYKEKEVENQNYVFFFFSEHNYEQKHVVKHVHGNKTDFTFETFNFGKYNFVNDKIKLVDNLIFREKRLDKVSIVFPDFEITKNRTFFSSSAKEALFIINN